jgi:hypothetical protein
VVVVRGGGRSRWWSFEVVELEVVELEVVELEVVGFELLAVEGRVSLGGLCNRRHRKILPCQQCLRLGHLSRSDRISENIFDNASRALI